MVTRCNNVGVRIYVDVLLNHMSGDSANPVGTAGNRQLQNDENNKRKCFDKLILK